MSALAAQVHQLLLGRGATVAAAESLTGGALGAALTAVPGVSATFRGGVTAYATDLKTGLLDVDADLLAVRGPVDAQVAVDMATGVRRLLDATYGVATTGVAGPDSQDGHPPGTAHVAVAGPVGAETRALTLPGDRASVRAGAVEAALALLRDVLSADGKAGA